MAKQTLGERAFEQLLRDWYPYGTTLPATVRVDGKVVTLHWVDPDPHSARKSIRYRTKGYWHLLSGKQVEAIRERVAAGKRPWPKYPLENSQNGAR